MRYTTVIDITEYPAVYRNHNARLLYFHLVLKSGYHDQDRDRIETSIRRMATDTGLTISAVRHALQVLEGAALLKRLGDSQWLVTKWIVQAPPTPRKQAAQAAQQRGKYDVGKRYHDEIEEYRQRVFAAVRASTRDELLQWLSELQEGRRLTHHGVSIAPNQDNIKWLQSVIDKT